MSHELHRLVTTLLSLTSDVRLAKVTVEQETVQLQLTATAPGARCPRCTVPSSSVHSHYQRHLSALPWGTCPVHIQLTVRKFVCQNPSFNDTTFTERLPAFVAACARKTRRLVTALRAIGMAMGGQTGARLAARLRLPTSPATLLRRVRAAPMPQTQPCRPWASTSGPGGEGIGTARSWSTSRTTTSWTSCRTVRPRASRPGWDSTR